MPYTISGCTLYVFESFIPIRLKEILQPYKKWRKNFNFDGGRSWQWDGTVFRMVEILDFYWQALSLSLVALHRAAIIFRKYTDCSIALGCILKASGLILLQHCIRLSYCHISCFVFSTAALHLAAFWHQHCTKLYYFFVECTLLSWYTVSIAHELKWQNVIFCSSIAQGWGLSMILHSQKFTIYP